MFGRGKKESGHMQVAIIDPSKEKRDELAVMIQLTTMALIKMHQYDHISACTWKELSGCSAIFFTLNYCEDAYAAYDLRPHEAKWPLVVVTDLDRFGLDSFALGARHCLLRPLRQEAVKDAMRRCLTINDLRNPTVAQVAKAHFG